MLRIKAYANHAIVGLGLSRLTARFKKYQPAILMYHGLTEDDSTLDWTQVHVAEFKRQLRFLKKNYTIYPLKELISIIDSGKIPAYAAAITFDDGYRSLSRLAYPILKEQNISATFFITSGFVNGFSNCAGFLWPDYVAAILKSFDQEYIDLTEIGLKKYNLSTPLKVNAARNHICEQFKSFKSSTRENLIGYLTNSYNDQVDSSRFADYFPMNIDNLKAVAADPLITIGAHSRHHNILSRLDRGKLEEEIVACKQDLELMIDKPVEGFAYPNGRFQDIDEQTIAIVKKNYDFAITTEPGLANHGQNRYLIPRIGIGQNTYFSQFQVFVSDIHLWPRKILDQNDEKSYRRIFAPVDRREKIKILQLVEDFGTIGGAEQVVHNLIETLNPDEFDTHVALVGETDSHLSFSEKKTTLYVVPHGRRVNLKTLRSLISIIKKNKIDIIHSHLIRMNTYNWLVSLWCWKPSIASVHGIMTKHLSATEKLLTLLAGVFNSKTISVSNHLKNELINVFKVNPKKLITVHNAFNDSRIDCKPDEQSIREFKEKYNCRSETRIIAAVGHLREVKGYSYLLNAVARMADEFPDLLLFIAGGDSQSEERELKTRLQSIAIGSARVVFLGEFWDIATLFAVSDMYVSSSLHEGFSLTTVEAMAFGLPVVVTDSGGPSEIVKQGETGLIVPVSDSPALAEAIKKVLTDEKLARRLVQNGRKDARRRFSMKHFTLKHEQIYRRLVTGNGK